MVVQRIHNSEGLVPPHQHVYAPSSLGPSPPDPSLPFLGGIMHDPDVFESPEEFKPERYLESETSTIEGALGALNMRANLPFGAGRVSHSRL